MDDDLHYPATVTTPPGSKAAAKAAWSAWTCRPIEQRRTGSSFDWTGERRREVWVRDENGVSQKACDTCANILHHPSNSYFARAGGADFKPLHFHWMPPDIADRGGFIGVQVPTCENSPATCDSWCCSIGVPSWLSYGDGRACNGGRPCRCLNDSDSELWSQWSDAVSFGTPSSPRYSPWCSQDEEEMDALRFERASAADILPERWKLTDEEVRARKLLEPRPPDRQYSP